MISPATRSTQEAPLDPIEELRAQYVACSYLATACQEALGRFPGPDFEQADGKVAERALEFLLAVEWDWRQTLQELSAKVAKATSVVARYNPDHAEDADSAREGAAHYRTDYRRRPPVRRRL
jgi:uncharacterized membrane-anchored protein